MSSVRFSISIKVRIRVRVGFMIRFSVGNRVLRLSFGFTFGLMLD